MRCSCCRLMITRKAQRQKPRPLLTVMFDPLEGRELVFVPVPSSHRSGEPGSPAAFAYRLEILAAIRTILGGDNIDITSVTP